MKLVKTILFATILVGFVYGLLAIVLYLYFGSKIAISFWCIVMFSNIFNTVRGLAKGDIKMDEFL